MQSAHRLVGQKTSLGIDMEEEKVCNGGNHAVALHQARSAATPCQGLKHVGALSVE
jgi:hypothetical protein